MRALSVACVLGVRLSVSVVTCVYLVCFVCYVRVSKSFVTGGRFVCVHASYMCKVKSL